MNALRLGEPRLALIDPAKASEPIREAFTVITPISLFRAMANAETLYPTYIRPSIFSSNRWSSTPRQSGLCCVLLSDLIASMLGVGTSLLRKALASRTNRYPRWMEATLPRRAFQRNSRSRSHSRTKSSTELRFPIRPMRRQSASFPTVT